MWNETTGTGDSEHKASFWHRRNAPMLKAGNIDRTPSYNGCHSAQHLRSCMRTRLYWTSTYFSTPEPYNIEGIRLLERSITNDYLKIFIKFYIHGNQTGKAKSDKKHRQSSVITGLPGDAWGLLGNSLFRSVGRFIPKRYSEVRKLKSSFKLLLGCFNRIKKLAESEEGFLL